MRPVIQLLSVIILIISIQNSFAAEKPNIVFVLADEPWQPLGLNLSKMYQAKWE